MTNVEIAVQTVMSSDQMRVQEGVVHVYHCVVPPEFKKTMSSQIISKSACKFSPSIIILFF